MRMTLQEYAAAHPSQEPPQEQQAIAAAARSHEDRQQAQEEVKQIKDTITYQLEQGIAPQFVLYGALKAIGILTLDEEWAEAGKRQLDAIYKDLAQESLVIDNAAIAAQRLETMKTDYNEKLKRQLQRNLSGYRKVSAALEEALKAINEID